MHSLAQSCRQYDHAATVPGGAQIDGHAHAMATYVWRPCTITAPVHVTVIQEGERGLQIIRCSDKQWICLIC